MPPKLSQCDTIRVLKERLMVMGVAAYNRGSKSIREDIDRELQGKDFSHVGIENRLTLALENIKVLEVELEKAKKAYQRRNAELNVVKEELYETRKNLEIHRGLTKTAFESMEHYRQKHLILSQIVRNELSSEQYHEARQVIKDQYGI